MKVYILIEGKYPDRYNLGVFSTREAAEEARNKVWRHQSADVREFTVDELVGAEWGPLWEANIGPVKDTEGEVRVFSSKDCDTLRDPNEQVIEERLTPVGWAFISRSAISEEDARELVIVRCRHHFPSLIIAPSP